MNLEEKLEQLKHAATKSSRERELERQLDYLRRVEGRAKRLPAEHMPHGIERYVDGELRANEAGEYFLAQQALPFGRPYGKVRIGDIATADVSGLDLFLPGAKMPTMDRWVFLDTETTGLAGGTGTCAFLIGIAAAEGSALRVRQFFLRDFKDEKAALRALAEALEPYEAIMTFNGKSFDLPLLETRYTMTRQRTPFGRLIHLDLLHPARRMWKLRMQSCELKRLECEILGIRRQGDVDGAEIPQIYFDYLRTGEARGLQPVFFHNALDLVTLAALSVELAQVIGGALAGDAAFAPESSLDLFSLSRIFERAQKSKIAVATCESAIASGLPEAVETRALWQLASQQKRLGQYDAAVGLWRTIAGRDAIYDVNALEELAIHYEHRAKDLEKALECAARALKRRRGSEDSGSAVERLERRVERLRRKLAERRVAL